MNAAIAKLQEHGIHPSIQRIAIMEYLMKHPIHPTVEDVYTSLHKNIPTLSKTTVYNTLRLFSENGAATMLTIDERKVCFDACMSPHAHFMCNCCGKVYDIPLTEQMAPALHTEALQTFQVDEMHIYYKGTCRECIKQPADKQALY